MYSYVDASLVRAAAWDPDRGPVWPDLTGGAANPESWRSWLRQTWSQEFAAAVTAASPDLASQVDQICAGRVLPAPVIRRTVLSVLRYLLRAHTRATPFGLFAGVAAARIGTTAALRVGTGHYAVARPDAAFITALVSRFEAHEALRPHLMLLTSALAVERDGDAVVEHRPSGTSDKGPEHVQIRLTAPVREALDGARTPILWGDLAAKLAAAFPSAPSAAIGKLLAGLVQQRVLLTSLRPAMTVTDPLAPLLGHARYLAPEEVAELCKAPKSALDLRVDWDLTIPESVAQEAAAAARALTRLAPRAALTGWAEWHGRFLERYGPRAAVPVVDAIEALGYPPGYLGATTGPPEPEPLPDRDSRLIKLAHVAGMQGRLEVVLDDAALEALATTAPDHPVQPSTELTVRIDASSVLALQQGEFTLHVVGVARSAGTTTGRFLDLLDDADRRRMAGVYAGLPGVHTGALVAQISSAPLSLRAENVARAPQVAELVISLGDYQDPDTSLVPLADLAVTADAERLHLVSLSRRRPVHTLLLNAVEFGHHSHPLARFLAEAPAALAVPSTGFMWGSAAANLPFLPALRYRRTILSPARWLLGRDDLPAASAPWWQWDEALTQWRHQVRLPGRVYLSEADQAVALDLAEPSHRALLRTHVDRAGTATLRPAPAPSDQGWTGGRAHEVVIPLVADQEVGPVQTAGRAVERGHGHLPGCGGRIYLQLHGHPDRQNALLIRHLPALLEELGGPRWWFVRYRDPGDHLRVRLTCAPGTTGNAFERIGEWTRQVRDRGLITHVSVETYHPERARFGGPSALDAAERYFAADSTAALAQLATQAQRGAPDARAVTAASMVDIAASLLGDRAAAMRWLIEHTRTAPVAPPRAVYRQAVDLVTAHPVGLAERVTAAWSARHEALAAYRRVLTGADLHPDGLLPDLLHLHHVRVFGPRLPKERAHLHLARAAALSWTARARRTP
ncbi:lantibiotic dehydratase [Kitasatospora sp. NPDC057223]|uniref:lantibiotic dehydratase n=1 Tax=Kitasatospora sp. NPDC057223 TaxID=3346055 RepID=UPI003642029A